MSPILPRLRDNLDMMPSGDPDRPGIVVRDPFRYSESMLYLPPIWAVSATMLDGSHTMLDVQEKLTRLSGQIVASDDINKFVGVLREHGFLQTAEFERMRLRREADFRNASRREATHAGLSYPEKPAELRSTLARYLGSAERSAKLDDAAIGVAAPHVSPHGGYRSYAAAYAPLIERPDLASRVFVVLGTSHYGQPARFGLTRKPFATPLGDLPVAVDLVDELARSAPGAVLVEDYCHFIEHSIEFQCVFLRHVFGRDITILPILCGPPACLNGEPPENDRGAVAFYAALAALARRCGDNLFWVLGIDMAHVGGRYGDDFAAIANEGRLADVAERDRARIDAVCAGDAAAFYETLAYPADALRWCGAGPLYTLLRAVPNVRGRLLEYEQWNIDEQSVVSFAAMEFRAEQATRHD